MRAGISPNGKPRWRRDVVEEIRNRLEFLAAVGLDYLNLARSAATLSGGEAQRIRLATQIGSKLRGVLYVLDEPSIGLHPRDNRPAPGHTRTPARPGQHGAGGRARRRDHRARRLRHRSRPGAGRLGGELVAQRNATADYNETQPRSPAAISRATRAFDVPPTRRSGTARTWWSKARASTT